MHYLKRPFFLFLLAMVLSVLLMRTGGGAAASGRDCGTWNVVSSPNIALTSDALIAVAAISTSDIWAVGETYTNMNQTLIEHWDGTSWSVVSSPSPGSLNNGLFGIARVPGTSQVWAVGNYNSIDNFSMHTLMVHWNGKHWRIVSSPNAGSGTNELFGVAALSVRNIWAVGSYYALVNGVLVTQTLIERWDGRQWSIVSSPNVSVSNNRLYGVASIPRMKQVWTVGYSSTSGPLQTLTEFYCP
jgi:hypothetical protein